MSRILVTGASGFLGKTIIDKLRQMSGSNAIIGFARSVDASGTDTNPSYVRGNVLEYDDVRSAMERVDIVIHLAASAVPNPKTKRKVIVDGTDNVVKAAIEAGVSKIVFMSSYSASRKNKDATGIAKVDAEQIVTTSRIRYTILRPTLIYGEGGRVFEQILKTTRLPIIPVLGDGQYIVGPVYRDDVADITLMVIDKKHDGKMYTIIGELMSYDDFVRRILAVTNKRGFLLHVPLGFILLATRVLHSVGMLKFDKKRVMRAVESVRCDQHDFRGQVDYQLIGIEDGLRRSVR